MRAWGRTLPNSGELAELGRGVQLVRVGGRSWQPSSKPSKKARQVGSTEVGSVFHDSWSSSRKAPLPGWPMRPRAGEGEEEEWLGLRRSKVLRAGSISEERVRSWAMVFYLGRKRVK